MSNDKKAKELIQPIMDLFSAADGGVAFTLLRHQVLPDALNSSEYKKIINSFEDVSKVCKNILELKDKNV